MNTIVGKIDGKNLRIAVVVSQVNKSVTDKLCKGAVDTLISSGVTDENITVVKVPGVMEVPRITSILSEIDVFDGIIALGVVVKGETTNSDYVSKESSRGVAQTSLTGQIPVMFGILTTDNMDQAMNHASGKADNKGSECATSVLEMIDIENQISKLSL